MSLETIGSVAARLELDRCMIKMVRLLRDAGIRPILLKGPAIALWLYRDGAVRHYSDVDLLIAPRDLKRAIAVLEGVGYARRFSSPIEAGAWPHAVALNGPADPASGRSTCVVDLHTSFHGVRASRLEFWDAMAVRMEVWSIGGSSIEVPDEAARTMIVALHAGQHGPEERQSLEDLRRALRVADQATWREALALSETIGAASLFLGALTMLPEGRSVLAAIAPGAQLDPAAALRVSGSPPVAPGLLRLGQTRGVRGKLSLLLRELFPSPAFMRSWSELARRGPIGLVGAYVLRGPWLLTKLPQAVAATRKARVQSHSDE